jgi:glycerol-3-phosphate dehydrogenase subunit B
MHYDLVVIGMGLSGLMAAKTAVAAGQKVLILGKGMGSLCLFSNTIDVLGQFPIAMNPVRNSVGTSDSARIILGPNPVAEQQATISNGVKMTDSLSQWIEGHPLHPYSKVGVKNLEEALSSFLSLFPPPYSFQTIDSRNCLLPTGAGTLRPTFLIPITMAGGISVDEGRTLIVGFKGFKDFYAHYVADQLRCRGINLELPDLLSQEPTASALARLMEKKSFRENVGREIKKQLQGEARVGLPAVLGTHDPVQVKDDLEAIIAAKVFEIPILPPSIPGVRIFNCFKEWLIRKGATFLLGYSVSKAILRGKRCERIEVLHPPVIGSYSADRYVLATGRFIGGGLKADDEKVVEPIFNLPLSQPPSREDWFGDSFFSDLPHPIHGVGILTDASFQPVDAGGEMIVENVWAAGSILAHHHCVDEKSREGIEISTGYMAANNAMRE